MKENIGETLKSTLIVHILHLDRKVVDQGQVTR